MIFVTFGAVFGSTCTRKAAFITLFTPLLSFNKLKRTARGALSDTLRIPFNKAQSFLASNALIFVIRLACGTHGVTCHTFVSCVGRYAFGTTLFTLMVNLIKLERKLARCADICLEFTGLAIIVTWRAETICSRINCDVSWALFYTLTLPKVSSVNIAQARGANINIIYAGVAWILTHDTESTHLIDNAVKRALV